MLQGMVLGQLAKMKTVETVNVKQLASHELSVEQQLYYKVGLVFPSVRTELAARKSRRLAWGVTRLGGQRLYSHSPATRGCTRSTQTGRQFGEVFVEGFLCNNWSLLLLP